MKTLLGRILPISFSVFLFSGAALADSAFDGFHVGAKTGIDVANTRNVEQRIVRKRTPASAATQGLHNSLGGGDQGHAVWANTLFAGYGRSFGRWFYLTGVSP